jgi:SecD/SecF fusion protein
MYENYNWKYVITAAITLLFGWALVSQWPLNEGIDLKGGSEMLYQLDISQMPNAKPDLTDTTILVLQNRLDALAIKELSIRRQGSWNIVIQVPGGSPTEVENIKKTVETTGLLAFKLVVGPEQPEMGSQAAVDANIQDVLKKKAEGTWRAYDDDTPNTDAYDVAFSKEGGRPILLVNKGVAGKYLKDANRSLDSTGRPAVGFEWNSTGRNKFWDMTSANVNRPMAIVLDGIAQSAPVIRSAIGERGIIEGGQNGFDDNEVKRLIVILKAGALPAKPVFQYEQKVGATLGQAAFSVGGVATIVSMLLVLSFMVFYYKQGGIIANVALVLNIMLLLGTLAMFGATLTLPGIAGILLTAGMAVDANILIFERMREEKARGAEPKQVVEVAYDRAFWTIFDSHVTTLVTGLVLYWTGTGPIRGFAVTLIIGISISLFTSLFVTKAIYGWLGANDKLPPVNFRHLIQHANFDFMGFYPKAVTGSLILINVGFVAFLLRGQEKYGIDFTGGTVLEMRLNKPMEKADVDARIVALGLKDFESQRVGEAEKGGIDKGEKFQIRTRKLAEQLGPRKVGTGPSFSVLRPAFGEDPPAPVDTRTGPSIGAPPAPKDLPAEKGESPTVEVTNQNLFKERITDAFKNELVVAYPPTPGTVPGQPFAITSLTDGKTRVTFLANMVPLTSSGALTEETVRASLKAALTKMATNPASPKTVEEQMQRTLATDLATDVGVKLVPGATGGVKTFELTTVPVPASADSERRAYDVLRRVAETNGELTVADPFPRVDQIGGAVAKNLSAKAFISMFFAIIAIVLYVAFRFEFIWGIGAVLSLVHDLFTTMGFMAILDWFLSVAHIDFDAKINLPTVAAFLTLLGYSIADTIVVYDRIRERVKVNKLKHADAATINEAINGTLSRTILTSLTVFLVAVVLFFCSFADLKVIQGLSVAMCFGVVTGTYSSIFIAAPVILSDVKKLRNLVVAEGAFIAVVALLAVFMK